MAKAKAPVITAETVAKERHKRQMNQSQFWSQVGTTQSAGSRYESNRNIPAPVKKLLYIVYFGGTVSDAKFAAIR